MSGVITEGLNSRPLPTRSYFNRANKINLLFIVIVILLVILSVLMLRTTIRSTNSLAPKEIKTTTTAARQASNLAATNEPTGTSTAKVNVNGQQVNLSNPVNYNQTFKTAGDNVSISVSDRQSSSGNGVNKSSSSISVQTNN